MQIKKSHDWFCQPDECKRILIFNFIGGLSIDHSLHYVKYEIDDIEKERDGIIGAWHIKPKPQSNLHPLFDNILKPFMP